MASAPKKDDAATEDTSHQVNSPEVEHRLDMAEGNDALAQTRADMEEAQAEEMDMLAAQHERALALAAPIQKVTDGNETAALATITGQVPVRDMSDAPPPSPLGVPADEEAEGDEGDEGDVDQEPAPKAAPAASAAKK